MDEQKLKRESGDIMSIVKSFSEVDLSGLKVPTIVIYDKPSDFPEQCVARVFDGNYPTDVYMVADCLWILKFDIEKNTNLYFIPREAADERQIAGVYL